MKYILITDNGILPHRLVCVNFDPILNSTKRVCYTNSCKHYYCAYRITEKYYQLIKTKDYSWAVQHLQDNNECGKIVANYIVNNF